MTVRALVGLALLNALLLAVGVSALFALRGWRSKAELVRLSGVAYMVGVAFVGVVMSMELVVGIPFSLTTLVVTGAALCTAAVIARIPLARWSSGAIDEPTGGGGPVAVVFGLLVLVYLEALFRAGRLASLSAWDAWAFWVPKAEAISHFGELDLQFLRELPNPTYPPLVPALEASAFQFMGSPDVVTLHLQFWFFACGFVAAVAGLLAPRVPGMLFWPFLLLVLVVPRVAGRTLDPQADFLLDYMFALAALLVALWLVERRPWLLAAASLFLGAATLTKRDGLLLAACVVVAGLAASWRNRRYAWPRLGLAALCGGALTVPWHLWYSSNGLTGELPEAGFLGLFEHLDRPWPALRSVISIVFEYDLWLVLQVLVVLAIVLAFVSGARVLPTYAAVLYGLAIAGFTWVLWSFVELELPFVQDESVNPIVRLTASLAIVSAALLPLLADSAWRGSDAPRAGQG